MPNPARLTNVMLSTQLEILIALVGLLAAVVLATLASQGGDEFRPAPRRRPARKATPGDGGGVDFQDTQPSVLSISRPGPDLADGLR
jgi:hypothetical protein